MYQDFLVRWIKRGEKEAERGFVKRVGKFGGRHYVFLYTKQRIDVCARLRLIAARVWRPWFLIPSRSSTVNRPTLLPSLLSPLPWMEGRGVRRFVTMICTKISLSLSLSVQSSFHAKFYAPILRIELAWVFLSLIPAKHGDDIVFKRIRRHDFYYDRDIGRIFCATNKRNKCIYVHRILFRHLSMNFILIISKFPIVFFIHGYGNLELFRISLSLSLSRHDKCFVWIRSAVNKMLAMF